MSDKKKKLYYGVKEPPKNASRANMKEAVEHHQVRYFGLKKIDAKLLQEKAKKVVLSLRDLEIKLLGLKSRYAHLIKDLEKAKKKNNSGEIEKISNEIEKTKNNFDKVKEIYTQQKMIGGAELVKIITC